jgi:hypothetical protein
VRTGFAIGKSDIRLRVYDKTEELRLDTNDGAKRDEEHARWRSAGWNGVEAVVRVEFQLRGASLKELGIRKPGILLQRLDATWGYCGSRWARLVDLSTATRRHRCADDVRWTIVKRVTFERDDARPATRTRNRSLARARLVVGTALNFAASAGVLRERSLADARAQIAGFTAREAEAFVRRELAKSVHAASYAVAEDLLRTYGPLDAAAYVLERLSVAHARASQLGEMAGTARIDTTRGREFVDESPLVAAPNSGVDAADSGTQAEGDTPSAPGDVVDGCYGVRS